VGGRIGRLLDFGVVLQHAIHDGLILEIRNKADKRPGLKLSLFSR
jgi:hypothetical protein